ncbi:dihydrolipoyl dehydrogenase [Falseniella ignava]|uniref:Dihydrolipoyl dehydrogenase n=2 Tax=Falseniella ignava TaxID=137730 RepID=K1LR66_9LACT|nr:dihydrolipoyl dehydrogenase [Falseniella ignava]EKB57276.1 dihydrolipoyl dehydrogenase [Falseniella ignava CCUG 37419]PKY89157.1 dihydrolipoyl dehydrogenase [Falseniella ignava]
MTIETEVVVIGSGPGGYVAAIRAAQLGKKVAIIEKEYIGGVCLNVGCIPSKAMITAAHKYNDVKEYEQFGLNVPEITFDWDKVQAFRANAVEQLTDGVEYLLNGNNIEIVRGTARFEDEHTLSIESEEGQKTLKFEDCIIATGSRPRDIPPVRFSDRIVSSTEVLSFPERPDSLIVIGGGVIGIELATVYANFGTKVTVLEGQKNILPGTNRKLTNVVQRKLKEKGVEIVTNAMVNGSQEEADGVTVTAEVKGKTEEYKADYVMLSIGRVVNTDDIGIEKAGVELDEYGLVKVDEQARTNKPHIYAIGDIIAGPQLAHKASYEAKIAAEAIAGMDSTIAYKCMPSVVYSEPEIAVTGVTSDEVKAQKLDAIQSSFQYAGNGRAIAMAETAGYVNLISDKATGKVIGCEIVGANASDLINELSLAIEKELTVEDIAMTVHPHPTLGEIIMETAEIAADKPIHVVKK